MLKSLSNSAVSYNHLSMWLLVLLTALFQVPFSASSSESISHQRIELVESSTDYQVEHFLIHREPVNQQVTQNFAVPTNIQFYHDQQMANAEIIAKIIRDDISMIEQLRLLPVPTTYDDETTTTYLIG